MTQSIKPVLILIILSLLFVSCSLFESSDHKGSISGGTIIPNTISGDSLTLPPEEISLFLHENRNIKVATTKIASDGTFNFTNLPFDSYDILSKDTSLGTLFREIILSESHPSYHIDSLKYFPVKKLTLKAGDKKIDHISYYGNPLSITSNGNYEFYAIDYSSDTTEIQVEELDIIQFSKDSVTDSLSLKIKYQDSTILVDTVGVGYIDFIDSSFTLFFEGFESPILSYTDSGILYEIDENTTSPILSWPQQYNRNLNNSYFMFGPNDIFYLAQDNFHEFARPLHGNNMLVQNLKGRNNYCNICGSDPYTLTQDDISSGCIRIDSLAYDSIVYNKTGAFSVWKVASSSPTELCLDFSKALAPAINGPTEINPGDELQLPRICGINGSIGTLPDNRSECLRTKTKFSNTTEDMFSFNDTLSRRIYLYIPSPTILPGIGIGLFSIDFRDPESQNLYSIQVLVSTQRESKIEVNGILFNDFLFSDLKIERDRWYYIEDVMIYNSEPGVADGKYMLYGGEAGGDNSQPLLVKDSIEYFPLNSISFQSGMNHRNEMEGYLFFDNISIGKRKFGDR